MTYVDIPVIIPVLATGYLLTVYLLLVLAQRHSKNSKHDGISAPKTLQEGVGRWE